MKVCSNCGQEQESGKFCGACGGALQPVEADRHVNQVNHQAEVNTGAEQSATTTAADQEQQQASQTTENVKNALGDYWAYFLGLLKNPTDSFRANENHFVHGLVTMALYALAFSLSMYFLANSFASAFPFRDASLPFFGFNFRMILVIALFVAITFGISLGMTKLAKDQNSVKTIISQYGGLLVPFTALNILAILGGLIGSVFLTIAPLAISYSFTFLFIPVLFVFEKASQVNQNGQKVYFSLVTLLFIALGAFILGEAFISNMLSDISNIFRF